MSLSALPLHGLPGTAVMTGGNRKGHVLQSLGCLAGHGNITESPPGGSGVQRPLPGNLGTFTAKHHHTSKAVLQLNFCPLLTWLLLLPNFNTSLNT